MMPRRAVPAASQTDYVATMQPDFAHTPVLLDEVLALAARRAPKRIVDCTVGGGGHAAALLQAHPQALYLGIDRDPAALGAAARHLAAFAPRVRLVHGEMGDLRQVLQDEDFGQPDFLLADFGVSSHQLDVAERGFSFRFDGPLDMRMDPTRGCDAATLIARMDVPSLAHVLRTLGDERFAGPVARAMVAQKPRTTFALAELVRGVIPKGLQKIDPATRTFQAQRVY
ncbi:MAG: 16S rRNA (cytosine(1402)-N(4))-methyltransferase, partial [Deltaproteobacteria bacterium]